MKKDYCECCGQEFKYMFFDDDIKAVLLPQDNVNVLNLELYRECEDVEFTKKDIEYMLSLFE
jgi:hypothetical protein